MPISYSVETLQILIPAIVATVLGYCVLRYWIRSRNPAKKLQRQLQELTKQVQNVSKQPPADRRKGLGEILRGGSFEHHWVEFEDTLHDQFATIEGESRIVRTRATAPAAYFFSVQKIIETPLKTEYFKHLPGILTGIGIIGTFAGLLIGLSMFDTSDPTKVQASVTLLLHGVRDAFYASAFAIALAMYITYSEKENLRKCILHLEEFTDAIDHLFDTGVAEEYLAELVRHTQESSVQTRLLKDSLVTDLREMLQNLVDTQVRENLKLAETLSHSYKDAGRDMATQISQSIESSFREPLDQIARSVQAATGDQSGQVQNLLQEVLVAFMQKLESTFGNQFNDMQAMLSQSIAAIQQMQGAFTNLIQDMRSAGEASSQAVQQQLAKTLSEMHTSQAQMQAGMNEMVAQLQSAIANIGTQGEQAGNKMAEQLQRLFSESEARQQAMANQLDEFVKHVQETVGQGHAQATQRVAGMVDELSGKLGGLITTFESNRQNMDRAAFDAQEQLQTNTQGLLDELNGQVKTLLTTVQEGHEATRQTILMLGEQTQKNLTGMQQGADKMHAAANQFTHAGHEIVQVGETASKLSTQLQASAQSLGVASTELGTMLADYRQSREAVRQTMATIENMVANAQAEAGMRGQILLDLRSMNDRMHALNEEANQYLEQVTGVLTNSFDQFGSGVEKSLARTLASFDAELDKAIKSLGGGVQELSENLETFGEMVEKSVRKYA